MRQWRRARHAHRRHGRLNSRVASLSTYQAASMQEVREPSNIALAQWTGQ